MANPIITAPKGQLQATLEPWHIGHAVTGRTLVQMPPCKGVKLKLSGDEGVSWDIAPFIKPGDDKKEPSKPSSLYLHLGNQYDGEFAIPGYWLVAPVTGVCLSVHGPTGAAVSAEWESVG